MKATCIVGSARSNGSCARLIDALIKGMREDGIAVNRHCIGDASIHYCLGCKKCYKDGICIQKEDDDVHAIVLDILHSDLVAIAAPSYWADVPGQLKVFFDRNTPYGDTNPNRVWTAGKPIKGIAIAVRAGTHSEENELILNAIQHYYGHLGIQTVKRFSICGVDTPDDLTRLHPDMINELYLVGKSIRSL